MSAEPEHSTTIELEPFQPAEFEEELRRVAEALPRRINIDPESVEQDLAKLVLTLVDFVRKLLEKQAIRRIDGGGVSPEQVERMGLALMKLEAKVEELKEQFGLAGVDLNLNLGPAGRLI
jgi:hypothetical protein